MFTVSRNILNGSFKFRSTIFIMDASNVPNSAAVFNKGRVSLVATYLFLLVHNSAELNAFDLSLLTRKVAQSCKKD